MSNSTRCLLAQLRTELEAAGLTPSRRTYELLTRSHIVRRDVAAMLASLRVSLAATAACWSWRELCVLHQTENSHRFALAVPAAAHCLFVQPLPELAASTHT